MKLRDGLIGHYHANCVLPFTGSDDEENLNKRLKTEPADWYYRSANISYSFNSLGHRSVEPHEIDFDNYILTTGCSHTEGIGVALEDSYAYVLSKRLGCDYYNLGLGGTGIDTVIHNLTMWLSRYKPPKALIVQWPHHARFLTARTDPDTAPDSEKDIFVCHGAWSYGEGLDMILTGESLNYFKGVRDLAKIKIDSLNITTVHVTPSHEASYPDVAIPMVKLDLGRDAHYGRMSNKALALSIHHSLLIKEKYK